MTSKSATGLVTNIVLVAYILTGEIRLLKHDKACNDCKVFEICFGRHYQVWVRDIHSSSASYWSTNVNNSEKFSISNFKKSNYSKYHWQRSSICSMVDTLSICSCWNGDDHCSAIEFNHFGYLDTNLWPWNCFAWKSISNRCRLRYRDYIYRTFSRFCQPWNRKMGLTWMNLP